MHDSTLMSEAAITGGGSNLLLKLLVSCWVLEKVESVTQNSGWK